MSSLSGIDGSGLIGKTAAPPLRTTRHTGAVTLLDDLLSRPVMMLCGAALLLRVIAMCVVPLIPEEAYYWMYAQHADPSYFDHPPMVAWVIRLGTLLFGDSELGVRAVGAVLMVASSALAYRLGAAWFTRAAGVAAAILIQALPVYFGIGLVAPMDATLCCFWLACLVCVTEALRSERPGYWYLAGAAMGAALLTKYTAIFLPAGVVLAVAGNRRWRHHLRTPYPYAGVALGLLMFSPVVYWNAEHGWASFRFQFSERYARDTFNLRTPLLFLVGQLLVLTPIVLAAAWVAARRGLRATHRSDGHWFALACALPGLAAAAWTSLRSDVHVNWTPPILLSVLPAACATAFALDRLRARRGQARKWSAQLHTTVAVCAAVMLAMMLYLLILQPRLRLLPAFGPWHDVATVVEEQEDRLEAQTGRPPRIIGDGKYQLASVIAFYRMPIEAHPGEVIQHTTSQWVMGREGLGYRFWSTMEDWEGVDVIYVSDDKDFLAEIKPYFESIEVIDDARLRQSRQYHVAVGHRLLPARAVSRTRNSAGRSTGPA